MNAQALGDSDPEVRESAASALAALRRLIGDKPYAVVAATILEDKQKVAKVDECYDKVMAEVGAPGNRKKVSNPLALRFTVSACRKR